MVVGSKPNLDSICYCSFLYLLSDNKWKGKIIMDDKYTDKQVCDILGDNHFSNLLQYVLHMFGTMPRSMTEEEIVQYLKMNKNIGIVFKFMPEEVRELVYITPISIFRFFDGKEWIKSEKPFIRDNDIICLPDNYELKKIEKTGEWVEFEIDEGGDFGYLAKSEKNDRYKSSYYSWDSWQKFLEDSRLNERGFTTFGGWQYEDSKRWYLAPAVKLQDGKMWNSYVIEESGEATPVIPVKIRFWKEYK